MSSSLLSKILKNANYTRNSLESKRNYLSCDQVYELFCNPDITDKYVATHSLFDCEDYLFPSSNSWSSPDSLKFQAFDSSSLTNLTKLIQLAPSAFQLSTVVSNFLQRYALRSYAIVYAESSSNDSLYDIAYYKQYAANLVYKLSADASFQLDFSYSLYDIRLGAALSSKNKSKFYFKKMRNQG